MDERRRVAAILESLEQRRKPVSEALVPFKGGSLRVEMTKELGTFAFYDGAGSKPLGLLRFYEVESKPAVFLTADFSGTNNEEQIYGDMPTSFMDAVKEAAYLINEAIRGVQAGRGDKYLARFVRVAIKKQMERDSISRAVTVRGDSRRKGLRDPGRG